MSSDFGIKIALPGTDASTTNNPNDLTLNTQYPFHKLDVTKTVSFQNINITIAHNPPSGNLAPSGYWDTLITKTVLYQFAHGYNYIPTTWFQCQNNIINYNYGPSNALAYQGRFTLVGTTDDFIEGSAFGYIGAEVDATNVTIYALQLVSGNGNSPGPSPINMVGVTLNYRVYTFAEQLAPYGT